MSLETVTTIDAGPLKAHPARAISFGESVLARRIWICLLFLGPAPLLVKLGESLWEREQYQFFPLMIAGAFLLAWERWQDRPPRIAFQGGSPSAVFTLLFLAMGVLAVGAFMWVRSLAGVCVLLLLTAIAWDFGGRKMLRLMGPSLVLLMTLIPPPGRQEQTITLRLQQMAVGISSRLLDALHVPHIQAGNILEIPGKRLLVAQACSGINSLMAVLAFSLLYSFWKRRPHWRLVILVPTAGFFVVWGNIVRITGEAWLKIRCNIDVLEGTKHELMGLILFIACVGLVASFDSFLELATALLQRALALKKKSAPPIAEPSTAKAPSLRKVTWPAWAFAACFALSGVWVEARVFNAWSPSTLKTDPAFDLPQTLSGWQKVKKAPMLVERPQTEASTSFVWQYRRGDLIACVAFDYPFTGYHDLTICYAMTGWKLLSQETSENTNGAFLQVVMHKPPGQDAYLLFGQTNERGESVIKPPKLSGEHFADQFEVARRTALGGPTYQMQAFAQQYLPLTAEQQAATKELFMQAREQLKTQLLSQLQHE